MKKRILSLVLALVLMFTMASNVFAAEMITLNFDDQYVDSNTNGGQGHVVPLPSIRAYTTASMWVENQTATTQMAAIRVYENGYIPGVGWGPVQVSETIITIPPNGEGYISQFGDHFHNTGEGWLQLISTGPVTFTGYFKYSDPN